MSIAMADSDSDSSYADEIPHFPCLSKKVDLFFPEDCSKWLMIIEQYIKETNPTVLNLENKGIKSEEVVAILRWVEGSEITDLCLKCNNLKGGMSKISKILVNSKIQKLDLQKCHLSAADLLHLFEVLNNTQITNLNLCDNKIQLKSEADRKKFLLLLRKSHLVTFKFDVENLCNNEKLFPFLKILPSTSISSFELYECCADDTHRLFPILQSTQITKLDLSCQYPSIKELKLLSLGLRNSNVTHLNLRANEITDIGVDMLALTLNESKVIDLNLSCNEISGSNSLGSQLKDTQIKCLNLNYNPIKNREIFCFPYFLKDSSVETLLLDDCNLGDDIGQELIRSLKFSPVISRVDLGKNQLNLGSINEFSKIIKDSNIKEIDFSCNDLPLNALATLSDCLKDSKIEKFKLSVNLYKKNSNKETHPAEVSALISILNTIKNSSITFVDLFGNNFKDQDLEKVGSSIEGSSITNLILTFNYLKNVGTNYLVPHLKFTAITHLNISSNGIGDKGAEAIAKCLKETKILELNMFGNWITCNGAKLMAPHLRGTQLLNLILDQNFIKNEGLEALANGIENTEIVISVNGISGLRNLLLDRILFKNRIFIHQFISQFKKLAPLIQSGNFCPDSEAISPSNPITSLENHFQFFKMITNEPWMVKILTRDKDLSFTKEQLVSLLFEVFPRQLAFFIANHPVSDVVCKVNILRRAEELNLNSVVEHLLLHRPVFTIDENEGILHPYFYLLLHKYKLPIFHSAIEPDGNTKIINYFTEHPYIIGATDVIQLLSD